MHLLPDVQFLFKLNASMIVISSSSSDNEKCYASLRVFLCLLTI